MNDPEAITEGGMRWRQKCKILDHRPNRVFGHYALTKEHKARVRVLATDFPRLWSDPATPVRERKRIARLIIEDVTIDKADQIHLHIRFRGGQTTSIVVPIPPKSYQVHQIKPEPLAALDHLLDIHTDAQAPEALNRDGHRSGTGQAFTPFIVLHLRRRNGLPSHLERLWDRGLFTIAEVAECLCVSTSTIKAWHRAGLLISHQANDKNTRLFEQPSPDDPSLVKRMGRQLDKRVLTQASTGSAV